MKTVFGKMTMSYGCLFLLLAIMFAGLVGAETRAPGDGVEGVKVTASISLEDGTTRSFEAVTDNTGSYNMVVPPGTLNGLRIMDHNLPDDYLSSHIEHSANGENLDSNTTLEREFTLTPTPPSTITVQGYLHREGTEPGQGGISIRQADRTFYYYWEDNQDNYYMNWEYREQDWTTVVGTESNGYYSFTAPPGDFYFSIYPPGYEPLFHPFFSASTDRWANFSLTQEPAKTCTIDGAVTGDDAPLQGVYAAVNGTTSGGRDWWGGGYTDTNGEYSISVPPGNYWVTFAKSGWETVNMPAGVVESGVTTIDADLVNTRVNALHVVTRDASTGDLLPDCMLIGYGYTNNSGEFHDKIVSGQGNITASKNGYYPKTVPFNMPADDNITKEISLQPIVFDTTIHGEITGIVGPLTNARVIAEVTNDHGTYTDYTWSNETGYYFLNLPAGRVLLTFSDGNYPSTHYKELQNLETSPQGEYIKNIYLEPITNTVTIRGAVKEGTYTGGPTPLPDNLDGRMLIIPGDPDDTTPPAKIDNLAVAEVGTNYATLVWTAVGDDGNEGTAFAYIVAYSNVGAIIAEGPDQWEEIMETPGIRLFEQRMSPKPAGQRETLRVTGLESDTRYWFFVAVVDDAGLWNASNSPSAKTAKVLENTELLVNATSGGTVSLQDAAVSIPPGALSDNTTITIDKLDIGEDEAMLGVGLQLAGNIFEFGPPGTVFSEPVTITLPYDPSMVGDDGEVAIYLWNSTTQTWEALPNPQVDEAAGTVSVRVWHFSRYAVLATADEIASGGSRVDETPVDSFLGILGYFGPVPIMLVVMLLAVVLIVVGAMGGRREGKKPPKQPKAAQQKQQPPPAQPQYAPQTQAQQYQAAPPPVAPPPAAPAAVPMAATGPKKPTGGKCSQCSGKTLDFYDNGQGTCTQCGRTFWWDKTKKPKEQETKKTQPVAPPKQKVPPAAAATAPVAAAGPKKPSGGKCSQCGGNELGFYDDGSGTCGQCGRTFWWDKTKEPKEQKEKPKGEEKESTGCPRCGGSDISHYPDGSRMCNNCENIL